jgi:predicted nucleotidyltransferase
MRLHGIEFQPDLIAGICRKHRVARLSLFGSILTDRFGPASDIDVLVEYEAGAPSSYFARGALMEDLTTLLGRRVEARTIAEFAPEGRAALAASAAVQYAA